MSIVVRRAKDPFGLAGLRPVATKGGVGSGRGSSIPAPGIR